LVDTDVISERRKSGKPQADRLERWLDQTTGRWRPAGVDEIEDFGLFPAAYVAPDSIYP
jgi:hypothetical protein